MSREPPPPTPARRSSYQTRAEFSQDELDALTAAYQITGRLPYIAAARVAQHLSRDDLTASETATLAGKAQRIWSQISRDLAKVLAPSEIRDIPAAEKELRARLLARALEPGVSLADMAQAARALKDLDDEAGDKHRTIGIVGLPVSVLGQADTPADPFGPCEADHGGGGEAEREDDDGDARDPAPGDP